MQTFEYLVVPLDDASGMKKKSRGVKPERLNELGREGWEAVGVSLKHGDLVAWPVVLLKRPLGGPHEPAAQPGASGTTRFSAEQAREIGEAIGIDWSRAPFGLEEFRAGMDVELEHGIRDPDTDVTGSDPVMTGRIALAHLNEFPDYYTRLSRMEAEAEAHWAARRSSEP